MVKISPSLLSADFARLGEDIESVRSADYLHFDVMDGVFVPNISVGFPVLEAVRRVTDIALDVHLMVTRPARYAERFARAGADIVSFHIEADTPGGITKAISGVASAGKTPGIAIKPATPVAAVLPYIDSIGIVVVMSVEPGYGGQKFMAGALEKISELRGAIEARGARCELEVDGGINAETAALCVRAGADVLVSGNDLFGAADRAARMGQLRAADRGMR
ncbi:MAG: ribulose-phosphate 3-epimerase [Oscillospiraceae bacterium]|jgi:ribulose-phosphate 3-epimerase|nr:ribulose-phosphate 3-epimerase [Oscillospiraceae bacterium]